MYDGSFSTNSDKKIDLEALLDKPFDRNKLKSETSEEDDIDARVLIFMVMHMGISQKILISNLLIIYFPQLDEKII